MFAGAGAWPAGAPINTPRGGLQAGLLLLVFGGQSLVGTGDVYQVNGEENSPSTPGPALAAVGFYWRVMTGGVVIRNFSYKTTAGDATTDMVVLDGGVNVLTLALTGTQGVIDGLSTAVAAAAQLGLEYDAGTDPGESQFVLGLQKT